MKFYADSIDSLLPRYPKCFTELLLVLLGFIIADANITKSFGAASSSKNPVSQVPTFPSSAFTDSQTAFWEAIFDRYTGDVNVIHDSFFPLIIIDLVDFKSLAKKHHTNRQFNVKERNKIVDRYIKRYEQAIERLAKHKQSAVKYGAMEKRVLGVYSQNRDALAQLFAGKIKIRSQKGLKDEFERAALRAKDYISTMEDIFGKYGLPRDLTRIVFVESMFNFNARSKVGASGIWQFMPKTARSFMTVNKWLDERNSPLKATEGAAKLLTNNFSFLGSWALAITAYNHGASGMKRAVDRLKTRDMGIISQKFQSRSFGFASRNFYAEFLAARKVYNRRFMASVSKYDALNLSRIKITKPLSIKQLIAHTPVTQTELSKYNLCLNDVAFTKNLSKPLPIGYELFLPEDRVKQVLASLKGRNNSSARRDKI